jgi:hypothetical protein
MHVVLVTDELVTRFGEVHCRQQNLLACCVRGLPDAVPPIFAMREEISSDAVVLHDFARVLAIPLRDGCDLMDVTGRRLQAQIP